MATLLVRAVDGILGTHRTEPNLVRDARVRQPRQRRRIPPEAAPKAQRDLTSSHRGGVQAAIAVPLPGLADCSARPPAFRARGDVLALWAERTGRRRAGVPGRGGLRFAYYGRVSTEDWQDPVTSRARQREQAGVLVAGHGTIVAEFFDAGRSRTLPWARRLQAAALVAALADPDRGWDAVVIGEYERAFYGSQYAVMASLFEHYGVTLWAPEVGGRIDYRAEDHEQAMLALGLSSNAGDHPHADPGPHRDSRADPGAGPVPGRPPAVGVPAGRRGAASEQGARAQARRPR